MSAKVFKHERISAFVCPVVKDAIERMALIEGRRPGTIIRLALEDYVGYDEKTRTCTYPRKDSV